MSQKYFSNENFRENLLHNLPNKDIVNNANGFQKCCDIGFEMLNKNVPCKKHHHQSNQMSFLNKELSKAIMKTSRLHNNFIKNRNDANR